MRVHFRISTLVWSLDIYLRGKGKLKGQEEYLICVPPLKIRGKDSSEEDVTHFSYGCMLFLWENNIFALNIILLDINGT